jgi:hypothetical protein
MTEKTAHDIEQLRFTLELLIVWMAQSAASPISGDEAKKLLGMLPPMRGRS